MEEIEHPKIGKVRGSWWSTSRTHCVCWWGENLAKEKFWPHLLLDAFPDYLKEGRLFLFSKGRARIHYWSLAIKKLHSPKCCQNFLKSSFSNISLHFKMNKVSLISCKLPIKRMSFMHGCHLCHSRDPYQSPPWWWTPLSVILTYRKSFQELSTLLQHLFNLILLLKKVCTWTLENRSCQDIQVHKCDLLHVHLPGHIVETTSHAVYMCLGS